VHHRVADMPKKKLYNLYFSPNVTRAISSRRMGYTEF
jgi:hypothetical protein